MTSVAFHGPGLGLVLSNSATAASTLGPNSARQALRLVEPTGRAARADADPRDDRPYASKAQDAGARKSDTAEPKDGFQLSDTALQLLARLDPALERLARAEQTARLGRAVGTEQPEAKDTPQDARTGASLSHPGIDQMVFRAKVIAHLRRIYGDDPAFERALAMGTVVVRAVQESSDPAMQPELTYKFYRDGAGQDSQPVKRRGNPATGVGKSDFIAWWPK